MGGSSSGTPQNNTSVTGTASSTYDPAQMKQFLNSAAGAQYASSWNPAWTQVVPSAGNSTPGRWYAGGQSAPVPKGPFGGSGNYTTGQTDVTDAYNAFTAWQTEIAGTQANWQNYSNLANANEGGEGDNTITNGAAMSQRNALLGSLANAGNSGPTAGLGIMGANPPQKLGGGK